LVREARAQPNRWAAEKISAIPGLCIHSERAEGIKKCQTIVFVAVRVEPGRSDWPGRIGLASDTTDPGCESWWWLARGWLAGWDRLVLHCGRDPDPG
jgi:hypothetical protein